MVVVKINVDGEETPMYMDNKLHNQLTTKVVHNVKKKDSDWVVVVDGEEGCGKSVFAEQMAKILDPSFCLERMCMSPSEFVKAVTKARKGQCVVFDEAFTGLSSRAALSEVNKILVSLMMEMRQKNLFIILVMPTYYLLDKYAAIWRAKGLFHIYTKRGKRGFWRYYNKNKKKYLYLKGKQTYSYGITKPNFYGRFYDKYVFSEKAYRKKKDKALKDKSRATRAEVYLQQRNKLFWILHKKLSITQANIMKFCAEEKYSIDRKTLYNIFKDIKQEKDIEEETSKAEAEEEAENGDGDTQNKGL